MVLLNKIKDPKLRKAVLFILLFLTFYFLLNLLYYSYHKIIFPDTIFFTDIAAYQAEYFLKLFGQNTSLTFDNNYPKIYLNKDNVSIVAIYEGCNAANLYFIIVSFFFSYFKMTKKVFLSTCISIFIVNLLNLLRIVGLYFVSLSRPEDFFFYHKYLFNGLLLGAVVLIWIYSTKKLNAFRR